LLNIVVSVKTRQWCYSDVLYLEQTNGRRCRIHKPIHHYSQTNWSTTSLVALKKVMELSQLSFVFFSLIFSICSLD